MCQSYVCDFPALPQGQFQPQKGETTASMVEALSTQKHSLIILRRGPLVCLGGSQWRERGGRTGRSDTDEYFVGKNIDIPFAERKAGFVSWFSYFLSILASAGKSGDLFDPQSLYL